MPSAAIRPDLVRRLRSAEGHVRGIIGMIETGADCQDILRQTLAVQGALRVVNNLLLKHHLNDCLRAELWDADPQVREHALNTVVELYDLISASALSFGRRGLV